LPRPTPGLKKSQSQGTSLWDLACFEDVPKWNPGSSNAGSSNPGPLNPGPSDVHVAVKGTTHKDHVVIDGDIAFKKQGK